MDNVESSTETVSVVPTMDRSRLSVCSNGLTVLDLLPEGTLKALQTNRSGCFFYVRIPVTSLSEISNRFTLSKKETPCLQRFAIFWNRPTPFPLHLLVIVPDRFEHIHLRVNVQTDILFECGQVFMTTKRHNHPFT